MWKDRSCDTKYEWVLGPVSQNRFSENSGSIHPKMRETLGFLFHKEGTQAHFSKRGNISSESVSIVTDSLKLAWMLAGFIQQTSSFSASPPSLNETLRHFLIHSFSLYITDILAEFYWLFEKKSWLVCCLLGSLCKTHFCLQNTEEAALLHRDWHIDNVSRWFWDLVFCNFQMTTCWGAIFLYSLLCICMTWSI